MNPTRFVHRIVSLLVILALLLQSVPAQADDLVPPTPTPPAIVPVELPTKEALPTQPPTPTAQATPTPIETPTANPYPAPGTETPLPTPLPTETPPPNSTPTVALPTQTLPAETAASTPASAIVEEQPAAEIDLLLSAAGELATPGGSLGLSWQIPGWQDWSKELAAEAVIAIQASPNLTTSSAVYDARQDAYLLPVISADEWLPWQIPSDQEGPYTFTATLALEGKAVATRSLSVPEAGLTRLGKEGGVAGGLSGKVRVIFPPESVAEEMDVRVRPLLGELKSLPEASNHAFEIIARSAASKEEITQFKVPLTIEVAYGGRLDASLFYYDEARGEWIALPGEYDREAGVVRGYSDHLTEFDVDVNDWQASQMPTLEAFQVAQQTGGATYSYPFWTPPGPGGLQPSLSLSYNSQVIDSASVKVQSSWVGMGFSLDTGYIVRDTHGTLDGEGDDSFSIVMNGISGRLLPGSDGYYHTEDESFWRIQRLNDTWTVWDKQGNRYVFGNSNATRARYPNFHAGACPTPPASTNTWKWMLAEAYNAHNQKLTYTYWKDTLQKTSPCGNDNNSYATDVEIYPETIEYPSGRYLVYFEREGRLDYDSKWLQNDRRIFFKRYRLKSLQMQHDPTGGEHSDAVVMRKYSLGYSENVFTGYTWNMTGKAFSLVSVQESGVGGATLPATTFSYGDGLHLTGADNGYGGQSSYSYESAPWRDANNNDSYRYLLDTDPGNWEILYGDGWISCFDPDPLHKPDCPKLEISKVTATNKKGVENAGFQPGAVYGIHVTISPTDDSVRARVYLQYGPSLGDAYYLLGSTTELVRIYGSYTYGMDAVIPANAQAENFYWVVECAGTCRLSDLDATLLPTRYRVVTRTLNDTYTGDTTSASYQYDGPATNDAAHSDLVRDHLSELYGDAYDEYRGHAMVRVLGPVVNNLQSFTQSYYQQDDLQTGQQQATLSGVYGMSEAFDTLDTGKWSFAQQNDKQVIEPRLEGDPALKNWSAVYSGSWPNNFYRTAYSIDNNEMSLVHFRFNGDNTFTQVLASEASVSGSYYRWGLVGLSSTDGVNYPLDAQYVQAGVDYRYDLNGSLTSVKEDVWYTLLLVQDNDRLYLRLWERDNPANYGDYIKTTTLADSVVWRFHHWVNGNGTAYLDEYLEGRLHSFSFSQAVTQQDIFTVTGGFGAYPDLSIDWTRTLTETQLSFESSSAWLGTRRYNQYLTTEQGGTQYGNVTRVVESEWEAATGNWRDVRLTLNQYYPNTSSVNLVGLPGYENVYACPVNSYNRACSDLYPGYLPSSLLLSSHWYLYDNQVHFYDPPTVGILRGERDLLRFAGANYSDPRYADTYYTFDAWGNRDTVSAYRSEGTYSGLYAGTASVTTTCYGVYSGTTCTADNYHTFSGWERNAVGHYTRYQYDYAYAQPVWMSDANEQITQAGYDALGRMLKVAKPGDSLTTPTVSLAYYDSAVPFYTEAVQRIDASTSFSVRKYYNGMGWLLQTRAHNAEVGGALRDIQVDSFYNAAGKVSQQSAPYDVAPTASFARSSLTSIRTSTTYDALGRVVRVQTPDGVQHNTAYAFEVSTNRMLVKSFDPRYPATENYATKSYRDAWGRTRQVQPPTGPGVSYIYDALDRLIAADYGSAHTALTYDYAGRKTSLDDDDMGLWYYSYDASSNLATQTDARGCLTSITYDLLNRPTGKSYSGDCGVTTSSVSYTYDNYSPANAQWGRGQRTGMTDGSGSTSWMYDPRGRLRWESKTITGSGTFITEWSYNSADLVEWMKYPGGNGVQGEQVTFTYVPQMLVKTAYSQDYAYYYLQNASYDAAGRSDQLYLGAPNLGANPLLVNDSDYNAWTVQGGRRLALKSGLWGDRTSLQSLTYSYDAAGNVKTIQDAKNSNQKQCFTYDLIHRLTKATTYADAGQGCTTQVGAGHYSEDYTYNASTGNLASKTGMGSYTYGSASHVHAVTSTSSGWAFQYDLNGNATRRDPSGAEVYDLQYDAENRMVSVSSSATASFSYDGDGQRVKGTVGSTTTAYLGNHLEYSNGVLTKYYYAGMTRLAMRQGSTLSWLVGDHLGSTSKVANGTTGVQTDMQLYRAWGENRWPTTSTLPTTMRYTGQRVEPGLGGIYFYSSRWYDPVLSRWLSPDSIVPEAVQGSQAWDRYAYVNNSPINFEDPTGHCIGPFLALCIAAGTFIAEHAAAITAIATAGALLSFVGPSNPDLELINNPAASQQAYADSIFQAGVWLTAGASALEFGQYFSAPASTSYSNEAIDDYLYRFSEPSGDMVYHLKPGEDAMSMAYANEFSSSAEAFTAMTGNPPGQNSYYQTTTVGTLRTNGYYPVYDGGLGGMPPGHVSVYGNSWKLNDVLKIFITGKSPIE